jgi:hypothetical protein
VSENVTRYRVAEGREVTLPRGIERSPSGDNARKVAGQAFDVDNENPEIGVYQRFLRMRVLAGDLVVESQDMPTTASTRKGGDR